jgi:RimJ/RimL family protein N-acetyltransferase
MAGSTVRIEPWGPDDLPILRETVGDPEMTKHLGGPETEDQLIERQARYESADPSTGRMFRIVDDTSGESIGSVGYWDRAWRDDVVYETGWFVIPAFQGRGIASAATAQAIELARADGKHRFMHAFPSVDNGASNAVCAKLGFTLLEALEFEYPPGHPMRCNDWQLDLKANG